MVRKLARALAISCAGNSKDTGVTPGIWNITVLLLASIVNVASTTNNDVTQFTLLFPVLFTNPSDQDHLENIVEGRIRPTGADAIRLGYSIYSELYKQVSPERESWYRREVGYDASFIPATLTIDARSNTVMFQMPGILNPV